MRSCRKRTALQYSTRLFDAGTHEREGGNMKTDSPAQVSFDQDAPVAANVWHTLRVEFFGKRIRVALNGKTRIEMENDRIAGAGAVGVWTKADSVTAFDDFAYSASGAK
jgi:hypothetical protein